MKKDKLYNPDTQGTFRMMFGFKMPNGYKVNKWVKVPRTRDFDTSKIINK
jgi:hypothetical protein|tara:strand:+ start:914 stop:1063 length:150 start_codon:yes stop_codon:yes gene_type:complete